MHGALQWRHSRLNIYTVCDVEASTCRSHMKSLSIACRCACEVCDVCEVCKGVLRHSQTASPTHLSVRVRACRF